MPSSGDKSPNYWQSKSLQHKIGCKKQYRDIVLKDFRKQLRRRLKSVVDASNQTASHIGTTIPVDDQLRQFVEAFAAVKNLDQENIHIALSGYPRDSMSKEKRKLFLYSYDIIIKAVEPLTKGPHGQLFKAVHSALSAMIKLIDDFQDKMVKALTEVNIDSPLAIRC
jgi:hypothetical protein